MINTGVIYATHFDMLSLMESKTIMDAALPAVFLYPAEYNQNNQLEYLNTRIASEYRCKIIQAIAYEDKRFTIYRLKRRY